uniref:Uncharacterized protein n=1 Tax=Kalanchoe fedtschenkoi TaxID=63787 RepID=A0A7N0VN38_KALFE
MTKTNSTILRILLVSMFFALMIGNHDAQAGADTTGVSRHCHSYDYQMTELCEFEDCVVMCLNTTKEHGGRIVGVSIRCTHPWFCHCDICS